MVAQEEEEEEEGEEEEAFKKSSSEEVNSQLSPSSWLQDLQTGGPIDMVDVNEDSIPGWSTPLGDTFHVRGEDYLMNKMKVPGGEFLLEPLALDWMKSNIGRIDEVLRDPKNRVMSQIGEALRKGDLLMEPFIWAINLQVPSKEHYSLILYYMSTTPFLEGSLIERFMKGDDEFKNSRLKLIANIVKGPWAVKTAVGDHAICLLGKSLTCRYIQGDNFLEVDVDIGSSMVANAIVHLALNYIASLTVDLAFLIEGRTKDELPEKILGSIRFTHLELSSAIPIGVDVNHKPNVGNFVSSNMFPKGVVPNLDPKDVVPSTMEIVPLKDIEPSKDEDNGSYNHLDGELKESLIEVKNKEGSFQSRIWKSLEQGLSLDWWGRQQL